MGSKRNPRGTRIGSHKDKTRSRMEHRAKDRRVQSRLNQAREHQARLEARIELERLQSELTVLQTPPLSGRVRDAGDLNKQTTADILRTNQQVKTLKARILTEEEAERRRGIWPLGDARELIRAGYTLEHTVRRTGWPERMLADAKPWES